MFRKFEELYVGIVMWEIVYIFLFTDIFVSVGNVRATEAIEDGQVVMEMGLSHNTRWLVHPVSKSVIQLPAPIWIIWLWSAASSVPTIN